MVRSARERTEQTSAICASDFRRVVGSFATGVTVITTRDPEGRPKGFTANAFTSLSLDPPLVIVCVDKSSETYPALAREDGAVFAVNILADHQEELSRRFASKGGDKFGGVEFHEERTGAPILDGVLAHVECEVAQLFDGGDHTIVVGEVQNLGVNPEEADGPTARPLLFYRGKYNVFATGE